jgi:hypothetical protein
MRMFVSFFICIVYMAEDYPELPFSSMDKSLLLPVLAYNHFHHVLFLLMFCIDLTSCFFCLFLLLLRLYFFVAELVVSGSGLKCY